MYGRPGIARLKRIHKRVVTPRGETEHAFLPDNGNEKISMAQVLGILRSYIRYPVVLFVKDNTGAI